MSYDEEEIKKINEQLRKLREEDRRLATLQQWAVIYCLFILFITVLITFLMSWG